MDFNSDFARDSNRTRYSLFAIIAGTILFYLPFINREFIGDDWLWLSDAKMVIYDPGVLLGRTVYGYFRPLNTLLTSLWYYIFGHNAYIFSFINFILHAFNVWLLWKLLGIFEFSTRIRISSALFFGFFFLNSSAVEWISSAPDLYITAITMIFAMKVMKFISKPTIGLFL